MSLKKTTEADTDGLGIQMAARISFGLTIRETFKFNLSGILIICYQYISEYLCELVAIFTLVSFKERRFYSVNNGWV